jgi:hypothetical protein
VDSRLGDIAAHDPTEALPIRSRGGVLASGPGGNRKGFQAIQPLAVRNIGMTLAASSAR